MMGKFVHLVKKYQLRCRDAEDGYMFEERPELQGILNVPIMHNEVSLPPHILRMTTYLLSLEDATVADRSATR